MGQEVAEWNSVTDRGNRMCEGPEAGRSLAHPGNSEVSEWRGACSESGTVREIGSLLPTPHPTFQQWNPEADSVTLFAFPLSI